MFNLMPFLKNGIHTHTHTKKKLVNTLLYLIHWISEASHEGKMTEIIKH